jgi:hypothetical protein
LLCATQILKRLLPSYFDHEGIPMDICNKCKKPGDPGSAPASAASAASGSAANGSAAALTPPARVSAANEASLAALNALDVELYAFAARIFWLKAEACGVTPAVVAEDAAKAALAVEAAAKAKAQGAATRAATQAAAAAERRADQAAAATREKMALLARGAEPRGNGADSAAFSAFQMLEAGLGAKRSAAV